MQLELAHESRGSCLHTDRTRSQRGRPTAFKLPLERPRPVELSRLSTHCWRSSLFPDTIKSPRVGMLARFPANRAWRPCLALTCPSTLCPASTASPSTTPAVDTEFLDTRLAKAAATPEAARGPDVAAFVRGQQLLEQSKAGLTAAATLPDGNGRAEAETLALLRFLGAYNS